MEVARDATGLDEPPAEAVAEAEKQLREEAAAPFASNPELRHRLETIHQSHEQTIDTVSKDVVLDAGFTDDAAQEAVQSFRQFIDENRDEITALQVLYERPYRQRLRLDDIRALADAMEAPPRSWTTERLWQAYQRLDESRVRGSGQRQLADIVALVRYATGDADELAPFADHVNHRFEGWLAMQETARTGVHRRATLVAGGHPRPHRRQRERGDARPPELAARPTGWFDCSLRLVWRRFAGNHR